MRIHVVRMTAHPPLPILGFVDDSEAPEPHGFEIGALACCVMHADLGVMLGRAILHSAWELIVTTVVKVPNAPAHD